MEGTIDHASKGAAAFLKLLRGELGKMLVKLG